MCRKLLLMIIFVSVAVPCLAQGYGSACDLSGTWIGGSDPSVPIYKLTFVPVAAGQYSAMGQFIPNIGLYYSNYTGQVRKDGPKTYSGNMVASFEINQSSIEFYATLGIDLTLNDTEVDGVHDTFVLLDCNTLQGTIDWFGWYLPITNEKIPFVTQPEVEFIRDFNGGVSIIETYRRVPSDNCPACSSGGSVTGTQTP